MQHLRNQKDVETEMLRMRTPRGVLLKETSSTSHLITLLVALIVLFPSPLWFLQKFSMSHLQQRSPELESATGLKSETYTVSTNFSVFCSKLISASLCLANCAEVLNKFLGILEVLFMALAKCSEGHSYKINTKGQYLIFYIHC